MCICGPYAYMEINKILLCLAKRCTLGWEKMDLFLRINSSPNFVLHLGVKKRLKNFGGRSDHFWMCKIGILKNIFAL